MSKSLWETIQGREGLDGFWCHDGYCESDCQCRRGLGTCPALEIAREYLALRAVVMEEFHNATPERMVQLHAGLAADTRRFTKHSRARSARRADAWRKLT